MSEHDDKPLPPPWRPVVAYRPAPVGHPRPKRSLPGQLLLWDELPQVDSPHPNRPVCPHCGGIEFDDDGDCVNCLEPRVAPPRQ